MLKSSFFVEMKTQMGTKLHLHLFHYTVHHTLISLNSPLCACSYLGDDQQIIWTTAILSVISMQPLPTKADDVRLDNLWFVVEKSGMEDTELTGYVDTLEDDVN